MSGLPNSLNGRLAMAGILASIVGSGLGWLALDRTIERSAADVVDARLLEVLSELRGVWATVEITGSVPAVAGDLELLWQIEAEGSAIIRSDLLIQNAMRLPMPAETGTSTFAEVATALGPIRLASRSLLEMTPAPPDVAQRTYRQVTYWAAFTAERRDFLTQSIADPLRQSALLALAAFSTLLLVAIGLLLWLLRRPLTTLQREAEAFADGQIDQLRADYPSELQLVVDHLNRASERQNRLTDRTRRYVNKIAHDLKTPIAVIANALGDPDQEALARRRLEAMRTSLDRYSALAAAIGPSSPQPIRLLHPIMADAASSFDLLYRPKPLKIKLVVDAELATRLATEDADAILSNLLSNAHKHAHSRVRLGAHYDGDELCLTCEDDGPGLSEEEFAQALGWGVRLDQRPAGSGLGLAILCDFAELYEGRIERLDTPLGGLGVAVRLGGCKP